MLMLRTEKWASLEIGHTAFRHKSTFATILTADKLIYFAAVAIHDNTPGSSVLLDLALDLPAPTENKCDPFFGSDPPDELHWCKVTCTSRWQCWVKTQ